MALGLCALTLWFLGVVQASELRYRDDLSFEHTAPETPSLPPLNTPRPSPKAERQAVQTLATQIIHRRAPQAATTTQPAKLWLNGVITDRFPSYICGVRSYSLSNDLEDLIYCSTTASCATVSGYVCCSSGTDSCTARKTCLNTRMTTSIYSSASSSIYYCNNWMNVYCAPAIIGRSASLYNCLSYSYTTTATYAEPASILSMSKYSDLTLSFSYYTYYSYLSYIGYSSTRRSSSTIATSTTSGPIATLLSASSSAPSCVNEADTRCPAVPKVAQACRLSPYSTLECFCSGVLGFPCPNLCVSGAEPLHYMRWMIPMCKDKYASTDYEYKFNFTDRVPVTGNSVTRKSASITKDWVQSWPDYESLSQLASQLLRPWNWKLVYHGRAISGITKSPSCPSIGIILGSIGIVNGVVGITSYLLANRLAVHYMTCKLFGRPGSRLWPISVMLGVGIHLGASFLNAYLVWRVPGFEGTPFGELVLLWSSRPRLGWIVVFIAASYKNKRPDWYISAAVSSMLTEVILQLVGAVYIGRTVNFARVYAFYKADGLKYIPHGKDAHLMYAGAMLWICATGFLVLYTVLAYIPLSRFIMMTLEFTFLALVEILLRIAHIILRFILMPCRTEAFPIVVRRFSGIKRRVLRKYSLVTEAEDQETPAAPAAQPSGAVQMQVLGKQDEQPSNEAITQSGEETVTVTKTPLSQKDILKRMGFGEMILEELEFLAYITILTWIGQWLFWIGFLRMAQDLYCPPLLAQTTAIWTVASMFAVFLSAAL